MVLWLNSGTYTCPRYRQSELVHARWAMLGVAGIIGQEVLNPDVFWYNAGLPENLPAPFTNINLGGLLAVEFLLMHWVEVRRWQDYKVFGSVNEVRCASQWAHLCARRSRGLLETRVGRGCHGTAVLCGCLLYTSPSPRDGLLSRMPSSA